MAAYYNEFNPYAAQWLRNLIAAGLIPAGDVDERSIEEVAADDLSGYTQCHFFAGIGGWSHALRLAGWPDDRPVWTGSCPCQPFSSAGRQKAQKDHRHLWPVWFRLIAKCRPSVVYGEQVERAIAHGWLDEVAHDLGGAGYAVGAAVLPACSVGAPHKRDRLWFVANSQSERICRTVWAGGQEVGRQERDNGLLSRRAGAGCSALGNAEHDGSHGDALPRSEGAAIQHDAERANGSGESQGASQSGNVSLAMGNPIKSGLERHAWHGNGGNKPGWIDQAQDGSIAAPDSEWVQCPDGKARPIKPGLHLLAYGVSGRVAISRTVGEGDTETQEMHWYNRQGVLEGLGNAIVPRLAAEFIRSTTLEDL